MERTYISIDEIDLNFMRFPLIKRDIQQFKDFKFLEVRVK
ncbi:MAG: hypothetical protein ACI8P7_000489 [Candidatus Azotimanducaceae bacterium]|jgi:hypothetical protein